MHNEKTHLLLLHVQEEHFKTKQKNEKVTVISIKTNLKLSLYLQIRSFKDLYCIMVSLVIMAGFLGGVVPY